MLLGVDVQDERDDKVGGRDKEERAPVDHGRQSCSGHTWDRNQPRQHAREDVGPHHVAGARLNEVVTDDNNVDRDRGDEGCDWEGVSCDLRQDSGVG